MPFSDNVKLEANKKALFKCVACHAPFVEVHHIIPESEGGPDTLDNAAPLCAGCHATYGGNPVFRKQVRQMRDNWYDVCEKRFGPSKPEFAQLHAVSAQINTMAETLRTVRADQLEYQVTLNQIKSAMVGSLASTSSAINRAKTLEEIATVSGSAIVTGYTGDEFCPRCGEGWSPSPENPICPSCREKYLKP